VPTRVIGEYSASVVLATPKSAILIVRESALSNKLSGFRSRCMTPQACAWLRPSDLLEVIERFGEPEALLRFCAGVIHQIPAGHKLQNNETKASAVRILAVALI
jgi:hypothetical protein